MMSLGFHAVTRIEVDASEEYDGGKFASRKLTIHYQDYDGTPLTTAIDLFADTVGQLTIQEGASNG